MTRHLDSLGRQQSHEELAAYTFNPKLSQQRVNLSIQLAKRLARGRFLLILFRHLGRRLAFTPGVPHLWFEIARGEQLNERATEVLTAYFRRHERDDDKTKPEDAMLTGTAWVQHIEIEVQPPAVYKEPKISQLLMLGSGNETASGAEELRRVGRCLDWLYPDELDDVLERDAEANELQRLLDSEDRRPVLLVGPRQVGKTALVHEYVRRTAAARSSKFLNQRNTWLIAPARLISGMSYVGQWENRLLAILKEARQRQHLLYFDDLIGLFRAGQTSQSSLSVAQVLKPYLERREVRVLAEITPEAYRVLRERDRGLADLFHVLPVRELSDEATLRVLIGVQRQLEDRHRCEFALDVLSTVIDLQRRYVRDTAFPGKAAGMLRQLAVKFRKLPVNRVRVLHEFQARSGLALAFLNDQVKLERERVIAAIGQRMIGQEVAVEAAADVISIAKARLNDPERPLASFLFLGPTGVGKTQCAKAIAAYLFGDPERLVRFDMNEYVAEGSAARLAGTFDQPEGLLTAAVRRQPFAVILFDEIEKAHPEVFDLLLAVLGEGRLTDALGRTADFTNAIIVLTSNLGVREAEGHVGFVGPSDTARDEAFIQASERFFRPEFFNRLDRVIPFRRLTRDEVGRIAELLLGEVFAREGLTQRKCLLWIEPSARERVVDHGFDPELGARALKRAIERFLTKPLAARLAALRPDHFTVVRLYLKQEEIQVHVETLDQVAPLPVKESSSLDQIDAELKEIEASIAELRPAGAVAALTVQPEHYRYFALREVLDPLRQQWRELDEERRTRHLPEMHFAVPRRYGQRALGKVFHVLRNESARSSPQLRNAAKSMNIEEFVRDLVEQARPEGSEEAAQAHLRRQLNLLRAMWEAVQQGWPDRVLLIADSPISTNSLTPRRLTNAWTAALTEEIGLECSEFKSEENQQPQVLLVRGLAALPLLRGEAGTHLVSWKHDRLEPVRVTVLPVPEGAEPNAIYDRWKRECDAWTTKLADGQADITTDPGRLGPVVRLYEFDGRNSVFENTLDLRSGLVSPRNLPPEFLRTALLEGLTAAHDRNSLPEPGRE